MGGDESVERELGAFKYGALLVEVRFNSVYQTFTYTEYKATRHSTDGGTTWSILEWENPPMQLDVEYRTTERWKGKPVYTKLVDCGAAPDTATKNIALTTGNNASALIRWAGYADYAGIPLPTSHPDWDSYVIWHGSSETYMLVLTTTTDRTACNVYVQVWYVKG